MQHFLRSSDLSRDELRQVLILAQQLKRELREGKKNQSLSQQTLAMLFEKPSTRTRISFSVAMIQLGGQALDIHPSGVQLGQRETIADVAQTISRYVQGIMLRVNTHATLEAFAEAGQVPIINGLSDLFHPCQVVADVLTMQEHCAGEEIRLCYVGDGNNVCNSLIEICLTLGIQLTVACPKEFSPQVSSPQVPLSHSPQDAIRDANFVYTDVWVSMGEEERAKKKEKLLQPFQLNRDLLRLAAPHAKVMHCLPAHRGQEISAEVLDGPQSIVFDQAENRLHAQKALLVHLLGKHEVPRHVSEVPG